MKTWILAALAATAACGPAAADDHDKARQITSRYVTRAETDAVYPKAAFERKVSGHATLDCTADETGREVDCRIVREEPAGMGFGEAAMALVTKERVKTTDAQGVSIVGRRFETGFSFLAPGDTNADWAAKPTAQQLLSVYPVAARKNPPAKSRATIRCKTTQEGFLRDCQVIQEAPADMGFGAAALQLSVLFRMKPAIRNGKPQEGEVTIPIVWSGFDGMSMDHGPVEPLVIDPPWTRTPTAEQVRAAWPNDAKGVTSGQATLRCDLNKTGGLTSCDVMSELPAGKGFGKAARSLTPNFQVAFAPDQVKELRRYTVDVPFHFRDPAGPDTRKITKPKWIRNLTPEGMALAYPQAAVKAGVKTGLGVIACVVDTRGELTDCQVRREDPAGLDFGAAAMEAAKLMTMNPWSKEGEPLDGLPIVLPIRFNWQDAATEAATAPASPPAAPAKP